IGTLAAGVAHEINNPLTILKGNLSILEQKFPQKTGSTEERIFKAMNMAADRVANIVNGLRTYARSDTDLTEDVDLHKMIKDTLLFSEKILTKDNVSITLNLGAQSPLVLANIGKLQQILMNLLSNARDATEGLQERIIQITTKNCGQCIQLAVTDNGHGIKRESLNKIFDPFYTTKAPGKGTGLGLAIIQSFVSAFQGTIEVDSELNLGTTFTITFPLVKNKSESTRTMEIVPEQKIPVAFNGRVLIIDDEEEILLILQNMLSSMGLEVEVAHDGQEGWEKLNKKSYDYVITDLRMPRMGGDQLLEMARNRGFPHTKFIVMTGGIVTDYTAEERLALRQLSDGYLRKPFEPKALAELLQNLSIKAA
ncbi:MAG: ATP-binding protein, partial [Pseudomonadota bacterium]